MRYFVLNAEDGLIDHRLAIASRVEELAFDFDVLLLLVLALLNLIRARTWNALCSKNDTAGICFGAEAKRMQPEPNIGG